MSTTSLTASPQDDKIQDEIIALLSELPFEAKTTVKQFTLFLSEQLRAKHEARPPAKIVTVPASSLVGLTGLLSPGYEGNALEDTEALYDDI